jgi:hypothetical protein
MLERIAKGLSDILALYSGRRGIRLEGFNAERTILLIMRTRRV